MAAFRSVAALRYQTVLGMLDVCYLGARIGAVSLKQPSEAHHNCGLANEKTYARQASVLKASNGFNTPLHPSEDVMLLTGMHRF